MIRFTGGYPQAFQPACGNTVAGRLAIVREENCLCVGLDHCRIGRRAGEGPDRLHRIPEGENLEIDVRISLVGEQ